MQDDQEGEDPSSSTEFLTSELLAQSFHRAQNLLSRYDWEMEERRRELSNEISDLDTRKSKAATERRKSVQLGIKPPEATAVTGDRGQEAESLVDTLAAIGMAEDFDVSDLMFLGMEHSDLDRDNEIFQSLLAKARQQDSSRLQKMRASLKDFNWQQSKMIDKSVHNYRQTSGFYKFQSRLAELESQISKSKLLLSEKRYALKLMNNDSTSTEDVRLKFEAEAEESIRKLIATINQQKSEMERLTKKTEAVNADSDLLCKQVGEILHELEKEEKFKKASSPSAAIQFSDDLADGKDETQDLYTIFPFLAGAFELTEDMVNQANRLREQSHGLRTALHDKVNTLRQTVEAKRAEYARLLKTEEFRALERLKRLVKRLETRRDENAARLSLLETLEQNADAITAHMHDTNTRRSFTGLGVLRGAGPSRADGSTRRSIGGRLSVVHALRDVGIGADVPTGPQAPRGDTEVHRRRESAAEAAPAPVSADNGGGQDEEGVHAFVSLHRKYQRALDRAASARGSGEAPADSDSDASDCGERGEGRAGRASPRGRGRAQAPARLPLARPLVIADSQRAAVDLIRDQFEAVRQVYRLADGPAAVLVPFTDTPVEPFRLGHRRPAGPPSRPPVPTAASSSSSSSPPPPRTEPGPAPAPEGPPEDAAEGAEPRRMRAVQAIRDIKASAAPAPLATPTPTPAPTASSEAWLASPQVLRTQLLQQQCEAEHFQTFGLKAAVHQLLGFVAVLTQAPGVDESAGRLAGGPPPRGEGAGEGGGLPPRDSAAVAWQTPSLAGVDASDDEDDSAEALQTQLHAQLAQLKEAVRQTQHAQHNYKALLREHKAAVERYDKLKLQLFREVDGCKALRTLNIAEQQSQLTHSKLQLAELRTQVQQWRHRVQQRERSNRMLAQYFHGGHHLQRREPHEESGVVFSLDDLPLPSGATTSSVFSRYSNERYRFSVLPQRLAVFDDINALYERAISELQSALEGEAEESNVEEGAQHAETRQQSLSPSSL